MTTISSLIENEFPFKDRTEIIAITTMQDKMSHRLLELLGEPINEFEYSLSKNLALMGLNSYKTCYLPTNEYAHIQPISKEASVSFPFTGKLFMFSIDENPKSLLFRYQDGMSLDNIPSGRFLLNYPSHSRRMRSPDLAEIYLGHVSRSIPFQALGVAYWGGDVKPEYYLPIIIPDFKIQEVCPQLLVSLQMAEALDR